MTEVHDPQVPPTSHVVKPTGSGRARRGAPRAGGTLLVLLLLAGCGDGAVDPSDRLFGEIGEIRIEVRSPLGLAVGLPGNTQGAYYETLRWTSNGAWTLAERVTYDGVLGSETVRRSRLNPGELRGEYRSLVEQLTTESPLRLLGDVPQGLAPSCGVGSALTLPTQITVSIHDEARDEVARWVRCSRGVLLSPNPPDWIRPAIAGPDEGAARVVTAALLARTFTLGDTAPSTHAGTLPFSTLEQGEHSPAHPIEPRIFRSTQAGPPSAFVEFWEEHAGLDAPLPDVAWPQEMVVLAAVGLRNEAGDIVQITRVVNVGAAVRVEVLERVPGDFCSPASRAIHPYHLVIVPTVPLPAEFVAPRVERVPCGL